MKLILIYIVLSSMLVNAVSQPCSDVTGSTGELIDGSCVCDAANGFVSDGVSGCQCDASKNLSPTTSCYKALRDGHHCNKGKLAEAEGQLKVFKDGGGPITSAEECFQRCIDLNPTFNFGHANSFHWEDEGTPSCFCNKNDCDVNVPDNSKESDYTYQGSSSKWKPYAILYGSDCAASGVETTIIDGLCMCDIENGYISNGADGCVCDVEKGYGSDGAGGCQACSGVQGSTGLANSYGCVCENGYAYNGGGCSQCGTNTGELSTVSNLLGICKCNAAENYYQDFTGTRCVNQITRSGVKCKYDYFNKGATPELNPITWCQNKCGDYPFKIDTGYCYCSIELECTPEIESGSEPYYQIGECNFNEETEPTISDFDNGILGSKVVAVIDLASLQIGCSYCDVSKDLTTSSNGDDCYCDSASGYLPDLHNGCRQCGSNTGELNAVMHQYGVCDCDATENYFKNFTGTRCVNRLFSSSEKLKCNDGSTTKQRGDSRDVHGRVGNPSPKSLEECADMCGNNPFYIQYEFCYCYDDADCSNPINLSVDEMFEVGSSVTAYIVGQCNRNSYVTIDTDAFDEDGCMQCPTGALPQSDGSGLVRCECDTSNKFIPDGNGCHQCTDGETISSNGTVCECTESGYFGESGNCDPCNTDNANTVRGNKLCFESNGKATIVSIEFIQDIQNSLSQVQQTTGECPLNV